MRTRQHVNPLSLVFSEYRGAPLTLVPNWPIEVEIGCADAQFLFERARSDPERNYVGIDVRSPQVHLVNEQAERDKCPVHAVVCNANNHLATLFAPGSVDRVYINFPDPWFKRRHQKRRMVDDRLLEQVVQITRDGGDVFFQSDVFEIALDALELLERNHDSLTNLAGHWSFWKQDNPFGARSWRERNAQASNLPVWRTLHRRRPRN